MINKDINYSEYLMDNKVKSITYEEYIEEHVSAGDQIAIKEYIEESILKRIEEAIKKGYKPDSPEATLIKAKNEATAINRQRKIDSLFENVEYIPFLIQDTETYIKRCDYINYSDYICENIDKTINYNDQNNIVFLLFDI